MSLAKFVGLSLILLLAIFYYIGIDKILAIFSTIDLMLFLLSTLMLLAMHLLIGWRILYVSKVINAPISFKDAFFTHMLGMLLSEITPGRSGYMLSPIYLKSKGIESGKALAMVIAPQPFDYAGKLLGAVMALIVLFSLPLSYMALPFLLVILFFLLIYSPAFLSLTKWVYEAFLKLLPLTIPYARKPIEWVEKMQASASILKGKWHVIVSFVILSYSLRVLNWAFLFFAFGWLIKSKLYTTLLFYLLQPFISFVEFIPLPSSAGSGFSEAVGSFVFSQFGLSAAQGVAFVFMLRIQSIIVSLIFGLKPLHDAYRMVKAYIS